jgi:putative transposase
MKKYQKDNLIHARTCVYNVNYHIVWSVKYRRHVLKQEVANRLKEILTDVADDKEFIIRTMEIMEDHMHIFVSAHPKISPSYIVKMSKGISGRLLLREYPKLRQKLWKGKLWNPSYYIETIGDISEATVKKYIEDQKSN